jgi:hypothetical protein
MGKTGTGRRLLHVLHLPAVDRPAAFLFSFHGIILHSSTAGVNLSLPSPPDDGRQDQSMLDHFFGPLAAAAFRVSIPVQISRG